MKQAGSFNAIADSVPAAPAGSCHDVRIGTDRARTRPNRLRWNFGADGTWVIAAGASYPLLRWQVEP
jgi:hypothetical protein